MKRAKLDQFRVQRQNANRHTPRGLGMLSESIGKDGWIGAVTVAADGETFDGSARLEVLADAMPSAEPIVVETDGTRPVIVRRTDIPNTDDARAKRLGIGANRIQQADLDFDADVLAALASDIDLTQFWNKDELADLLKSAGGNDAEDPGAQVDKAAELQAKWGTALGQLWAIGRHRLLVGDCTVAENVARLMGDAPAGMMVTDPPYGVDYRPEWRNEALGEGNRSIGEVENDDQVDWSEAYRLFSGDVAYVWHAGKFAAEVAAQLKGTGFQIRNQIIWAKQHFAISRGNYHWQHEPCWYAVRKGQPSKWGGDRKQSTLWEINNGLSQGGPRAEEDELTGHGTQKPVECMERPIRNHDFEVIYDPFTGSGTTLVACEKLGRIGRGMELSPAYAAVTLERLSGLGLTPELVDHA